MTSFTGLYVLSWLKPCFKQYGIIQISYYFFIVAINQIALYSEQYIKPIKNIYIGSANFFYTILENW